MAFLLKRLYEGYFWLMHEKADPRALDYPLMVTPLPVILIIYFWFKFILQWGPNYMKNRRPFELKKIIMLYNIIQIMANGYMVFYIILARNVIDWTCGEIDYSESYWGRKFLDVTYMFFLVKILDLFDTVFFVLRKKSTHVSFLHTYHHFGMVCVGWIAVKFVGGGHSYFVGLANGPVHMILYSYYLLTSYNSKYGNVLWLKKLITQAQLTQFAFLIGIYGQLFFRKNCNYPKIVPYFFVPQAFFMIILFGDFYVHNYLMHPKNRKSLPEPEKNTGL